MQLLANKREANGVAGLGWINGDVEKLKSQDKDYHTLALITLKDSKMVKQEIFTLFILMLHSIDECCQILRSRMERVLYQEFPKRI